MYEALKFVSASATASRADAPWFNKATGVRSPIAIASPKYESKAAAVTATSATGTCQPTIWSRTTEPVTERSPIVIRIFSATVGRRKTRSKASVSTNF